MHISKTSNDNRSNNFVVAAAVALLYHSPSLAAAQFPSLATRVKSHQLAQQEWEK